MEVINKMSPEMLVFWFIGALIIFASAHVIWRHRKELFVKVGMPPVMMCGVGLIVYAIGGANAVFYYAFGCLISATLIFGFAMLQRWVIKQIKRKS